MPFRNLLLAVLIIPLLWTPSARADNGQAATSGIDTSPKELLLFEEYTTITATKHPEKLSEVPGSVIVITEKEIREKGSLTLRELLLNTCGISYANEGVLPSMRVRGIESTYSNKILVLLDGRKLNLLDFGNSPPDYSLPLTNIRQIEIIKGPGSALYGANAYAGVVNIITKTGQELNGLHTEVSLSNQMDDLQLSQLDQLLAGKKELGQLYSLSYGRKTGPWDYVVSADYWREFGLDPINFDRPNELYYGKRAHINLAYKDLWSLKTGYESMSEPWIGSFSSPTPDNRGLEDLWFADTKYNWELNEASKLSFRLEDTYCSNRTVMSAAYDIQRHAINSTADLPPGVSLIFSDQGGLPQLATNAVGGAYIDIDAAMHLATNTAGQIIPIGDGPMNEFLAEAQYDLSWPQNNYLLAGLSFTWDWAQLNYFYDPSESDQNYALFLQDEYHLLDNMILLAGARYDYNTDYKGNFSPRLSAIYKPLSNLQAKLMYGSAYRAPVFLERFTDASYGFYTALGNRDLQPEGIQQAEASLSYTPEKWAEVTGRYFYWITQNEIQFDEHFTPLYIYTPDLSVFSSLLSGPGLIYSGQLNGAPSEISWSNDNSRIGRGLELETNLKPLPFLDVTLNYTRENLYSVGVPQHAVWAEGNADIVNAMLGLHQDIFFLNFYAHADRYPQRVRQNEGTESVVKASWLKEYDVSLGINAQDWHVTLAVLNIFENSRDYDLVHDDYLPGKRIYRLNADYALHF